MCGAMVLAVIVSSRRSTVLCRGRAIELFRLDAIFCNPVSHLDAAVPRQGLRAETDRLTNLLAGIPAALRLRVRNL
jgi:hypothetical protein